MQRAMRAKGSKWITELLSILLPEMGINASPSQRPETVDKGEWRLNSCGLDQLIWDLRNLGIPCHRYVDEIVIIAKGRFENIRCDIVKRGIQLAGYTDNIMIIAKIRFENNLSAKWNLKSAPQNHLNSIY